MSETQNGMWQIIGTSILGASHERQHLPNQDAIKWIPETTDSGTCGTQVPFVISLADGHGSEKYFRSDMGAKFAVQVANEVLYKFAKRLTPAQKHIEIDARKLAFQILTQWKQHVQEHWKTNDLAEKEREWLDAHPRAEKTIDANPTIPYGTTLITALITETFILYFQVGDGNILAVANDGTYDEPVPSDKRNFANEAVSLCSATVEDFQYSLKQLSVNQPTMIMLATDGYVNSFVEIQGFYKVATDIWNIIITNGEEGLQMVQHNLNGWLKRSSQLGSGDDISVGIVWRMNAFQEKVHVMSVPSEEAIPTPVLPGEALSSIDDDESTLPAPITHANPKH